MCQFLDKMYDEIDHKLLLSTIPHPGSASTVRSVSVGSEAQYNIWVKSGSMERVQTFSGYIRSKKGKWLSFSIMANGLHVKNKNIRTLMAQMMRSIYEKA
jgi:D-alanyl-D-alanine carboxypeptidase/D-alanyl-D-alanine-endopeptidase (penicillin-binding protein 4)